MKLSMLTMVRVSVCLHTLGIHFSASHPVSQARMDGQREEGILVIVYIEDAINYSKTSHRRQNNSTEPTPGIGMELSQHQEWEWNQLYYP